MTSAALLFSIVWASAADSATPDRIKNEWIARDKEFTTADIAWSVVRDSRASNFGFADAPIPSAWHVGIGGTRWRVDGERWTVVGKDDRSRTADTDPARARLEFRQILLEQRLAGHQSVPHREPISVVMTQSIAATTRAFGDLERAMCETAIDGTRPLLLIHPERLAMTGRTVRFFGETFALLEERAPGNSLREFCVDTSNACRIVRVVEKQNGLIVGQSNLAYDANGDRTPSGWTVMRFDEEGNVVEFAVAEKVVVHAKTSLAASACSTSRSISDILTRPFQSGGHLRRAFRASLDSSWFSAAVIAVALILGYMRFRRRQHYSSDVRPLLLRTSLVALLAYCGILLLRSTPIFDPTLRESQGRISAIWIDVQDLRGDGASASEWDHFAQLTLPALDEISRELEECLGRQGIWALALGRNRPLELARLDLLGAAKHDLPAIVGAGISGNDVRDHAVALRLDRVDDHLAGLSSYVVMPKAKADVPTSGASIGAILIYCDVLAGVLLATFFGWWSIRRRGTRMSSRGALTPR